MLFVAKAEILSMPLHLTIPLSIPFQIMFLAQEILLWPIWNRRHRILLLESTDIGVFVHVGIGT